MTEETPRVDGSFAINVQLSEGFTLNYSGYVIAGQTMDERNVHLDQAMLLVERQRRFAELPKLEARLSAIEQHKEQVTRQLESSQAMKAGGGRTPSNRRDDEAKFKEQLNLHNTEIANLRATILSIKSEMAGKKPTPKLVA